MTKYESAIKSIQQDQEAVYAVLTDLTRLEGLADRIPQDKMPVAVKEWRFEKDYLAFSVDPVGEIGLRIIETEPHSTVKFAAEGKTPVPFNLWIQLKQVAGEDTKMKLTIGADLNPMMKMMVGKYFEKVVNMLADAISSYPF